MDPISKRIVEIHLIDGAYTSTVEEPMLKVLEEMQKEITRYKSMDLSKMPDNRKKAIEIQMEKLNRHIEVISSSLVFMEKYKDNFRWRIDFIRELYCNAEDNSDTSEKWANDKIMRSHNKLMKEYDKIMKERERS